MYLPLNETDRLLRESLARYLAANSDGIGPAGSPGDSDQSLWAGFANDLGLLAAGVPEAVGGHGGGMLAHAVIMEEIGHALANVPYVTSIVLSGGILARSGSNVAIDLLTRIIEGKARVALAHSENPLRNELDFDPEFVVATAISNGDGYRVSGRKTVVRWAPTADYLIVSARLDKGPAGLFLVSADAPGVARRDFPTVDHVGAADIALDEVTVSAASLLIGPDGTSSALQLSLDKATVSVCAEAVGAMRRMLHLTTEHARERRQFGVTISSFQALQHLMVDMAVAVEQADAVTSAAVIALDDELETARALASAAKVQVGKACRLVGQAAIQVHGGMGIADETPIGRYFKRTSVIETEFGTADQHLRRYARLSVAATMTPTKREPGE